MLIIYIYILCVSSSDPNYPVGPATGEFPRAEVPRKRSYVYIPNLTYNIYQYDWYYYYGDDDDEGWGAVFRSKSRIVRPARY